MGDKAVKFEPLRELAFGSIGASFVPLGSMLQNQARLISLQSTLNQQVYISFDGINNHIRLVDNSFDLRDLTTNSGPEPIFLANRTQVYVKQVSISPTSGVVWISVMFT